VGLEAVDVKRVTKGATLHNTTMGLEEEKKPRSPSYKNELLGVAASKKTNERSTSQRASN